MKALTGDQVFDVRRCLSCGLVFLDPWYSSQRVRKIYSDEYFRRSADPEGRPRSYLGERAEKVRAFREEARRLQRFKGGGRLLDVGCGPGFFLASLGDQWERHGIDLSPFAVARAREEGFHVLQGEFTGEEFAAECFDAVTLFQVLDHVPDPLAILRASYRVLKRDGVLLLTAFNIGSFCARVFQEGYRVLGTNHFHYFAPKTVSLVLKHAGFKTIRIEFPYFGTPYCSAREVGRLLVGLGRKAMDRITGRRRTILSPPFYGNLMRVIACKQELSARSLADVQAHP